MFIKSNFFTSTKNFLVIIQLLHVEDHTQTYNKHIKSLAIVQNQKWENTKLTHSFTEINIIASKPNLFLLTYYYFFFSYCECNVHSFIGIISINIA